MEILFIGKQFSHSSCQVNNLSHFLAFWENFVQMFLNGFMTLKFSVYLHVLKGEGVGGVVGGLVGGLGWWGGFMSTFCRQF